MKCRPDSYVYHSNVSKKNQLCTLIEYEGEKQKKKKIFDSKMEFHHPRDGQVFWSQQQQQQQRQKNAIAMI